MGWYKRFHDAIEKYGILEQDIYIWMKRISDGCDGLVKLIYVSAVPSLRLAILVFCYFSAAVILYEYAHVGGRDIRPEMASNCL